MTVLEAMNLLGLPQRPDDRAALTLALTRALEQTPRQHELLEEAGRCLSSDLEARESRQTRIERHSTREILLFDENRDAVMFGDEVPELPVAFRAPPNDDSLWMGDDSVIFEGENAMMSELPNALAPEVPGAAIPEAADALTAEIPDSVSAQIEHAAPPQAETVSGEWQLMLESLEAEGLIKPEEGFSDVLSAQMLTLSDTHPERLVGEPAFFQSAPLEPALLERNSQVLETHAPELPLRFAASLETPLFTTPLLTTPLFATPMLGDAQPSPSSQYASALETPLFGPSPMDTSEHVKAITFDESLLISQSGSLIIDATSGPHQVTPSKALETLPNRKATVATQLSIKPVSIQPSEPLKKQVTGRTGVIADFEPMRADRRSDAQRSEAKSVVPRTYRDVREPVTQVRRRRQPVAVWLLSVAALLGSAVFIAPNLAAQLRDSLLPRAAALIKPNTGAAAVAKPPIKVVKPAAIRPVSASPGSGKTVKPATVQPPKQIKPSGNPPAASQSTVSPTPRAAPAVKPPASTVVATALRAIVVTAAPRTAPRVSATPSSAASLPPVTRPEGFASSGAGKSAGKPVVAVKPIVAPTKPVLKPAPSPVPAPVASIEYQDKPTTAQELPGGLSRQEFGRQFLNRKQFEVWQAQQLDLRFESFAQIPLETQVLETEAFRAAVLIPTVRPTRPERP